MENNPNEATPETVDDYIALQPPAIQERLEQIRQLIRQEAPEAVELISYRMPAYKLNKKVLVYFAVHSHHIGMYPVPAGWESQEGGTQGYKLSGRGTIQFPHQLPLPKAVIVEIIRFRKAETLKKRVKTPK